MVDAVEETVRLRVPASSGHLGTARIFGAAAGRRFGADEEAVADVRLAVSEACTIALQASRGAGSIVLAVRPVPGGLAAEVRTEPATGEAVVDGAQDMVVSQRADPADGWGVELLQAMVSELSFEPGVDGQIVVSFVVPYAGHGAGG